MKIRLSKKSEKVLNNLESKMRNKIVAAVEKLPSGDVKPMQGTDIYFRLRVGAWRVIFRKYADEVVFVEKISPRGDAYKGGDF